MSFKRVINFASRINRFGGKIYSPDLKLLQIRNTRSSNGNHVQMGALTCLGFGAWFTTSDKQNASSTDVVTDSFAADIDAFKTFVDNHHVPEIEHMYEIKRDKLVSVFVKDIESCGLGTLVHFRNANERGLGISTLVREACRTIIQKGGCITINNSSSSNDDDNNGETIADSSSEQTNDSTLTKKVCIFA